MPTGALSTKSWGLSPISVLATEVGLRAPRMVTIDLSYVQPNIEGNRIVQSGSIVCRLSSGFGRIYPASQAIAATATTSRIVKVKNPTVFKVGDVISINGATAVGTIESINVATDTLTLTANATNAVSVNDNIIAQEIGTPIGIIVSSFHNLSTNKFGGNNDVPAYTSASVYSVRMPFWNATLQALFPEITLV